MSTRPYLKTHRLADVMALLQVLALDPHAHRSLDGVDDELPAKPRSADSWRTVALEHSEFFRVTSGDHPLSLISRHVLPRDEEGNRRSLAADYVATLLEAAMALHDRQIQQKYQWKVYIPLIVVITAGIFTLIGASIGGD